MAEQKNDPPSYGDAVHGALREDSQKQKTQKQQYASDFIQAANCCSECVVRVREAHILEKLYGDLGYANYMLMEFRSRGDDVRETKMLKEIDDLNLRIVAYIHLSAAHPCINGTQTRPPLRTLNGNVPQW